MNTKQSISFQFFLLFVVAAIRSNAASADETRNGQPVPDRSMVELIGDKYDRMAKYLSLADLEKDVSSNELTFFVPSDEAFRDVPWSIAQEMLVNSTFLRLVIENHIIPGTFPSTKLPGNSIFSVGGEALNFTKKTVKDCDLVLINSIPILEPDQPTTNGIVHGITKLILPQKLIDGCKCGQPKANDVEPTLKSATTPSSSVSSLPERIIAGHSDQPNYVTTAPESDYAPNSDKFLRRSQAANPESISSSESSGSTTPFPYYNVWDDLVANHNLTTGNQSDNKTREIEEERPRFFRTRIPNRASTDSSIPSSSSSPLNATNSGTINNIGTQGSSSNYDNNSDAPTLPPRFGLRRRVVIRPQPTPRPYQNNSKSGFEVGPDGPTSKPIHNADDRLVPSVYYVEDEEVVTPSRDNSPTYSPPLVYRPITSTTPSPFIRVTSSALDTRRRSQDGRLIDLDQPISDEPNPAPNGNHKVTRRPYFRRPVPPELNNRGNGGNTSSGAHCGPEDSNCLRANANRGNNLFNAENASPNRAGSHSRPESEPVGLHRPVTGYYLNDQTTPSTTFFDSTRRPTSRHPQDIWQSSPSVTPRYEDDSVNYVRRFGSQRPRDGSSQTIQSTTTTESPSYYNYGPVRPVDSRSSQGDSQYQPSRPSSRPIIPRVPKSDEQPTVDSNTIADILEDPGLFLEKRPISFSMFKDLMRRAGLHNLASSKRPMTVFLPTDDAFEQLENRGFDRIYRNPADLQNFLLRHLVNYPVKPNEMRDGLVIRSISNSPITIKSLDDGMKVYANGSPILAATEATNGYVYVLGKVVGDAEDKAQKDILKQIEQLDNASIFASLLRRSNLLPQLEEPKGSWTILVPDNEAFAEIQPQIRDRILSDPAMIKSLVGNHIINGTFNSEKLTRSRNILPLIGQKPLKIRAFPGAVIINNQASIKKPDLEGRNGIAHLINRVLLPEDLTKQPNSGRGQGRARVYEGTNDFPNQFHPRRGLHTEPDENSANENRQELGPRMKARKFVSWLEKSDVLEQLRRNGSSYTVIVPNDAAVSKLPSQILNQLDSEPENLKTLLTYHVIPGTISLSALKDGQVLKSLDDKPIQYTKLASNASLLSGAPIVDEYRQREMNFLVVDRVLYPPQGTIFDIVSGSPILTNISQIIKTANLVSEFSDSPGPYTLFAPTDQAFASLGPDELIKITRDIKSSRDFLVKHTLKSILFTSAIPMNDRNGIELENINKTSITLQRKPHYVTANGVPLAYADISATNGVIHVLSKIL